VGKIRAMSLFYKSIDNQLNKINAEHMTHNQVVTGSSPVGPGERGIRTLGGIFPDSIFITHLYPVSY